MRAQVVREYRQVNGAPNSILHTRLPFCTRR